MTINLQSIFISNLNSGKRKEASDCHMKEKKFVFESINIAGACRLFKPCHQAPLEAK